MAQVIVELTGDEKRLLESYRKSQQADAEYRAKLAATGQAGKKAGDQVGDSFVAGGKRAGKDGVDPILKGLSRIGPEGRAVRKELEGHFRETGKFGRKSMGDVIDELQKLDPAAAEVARSVSADFEKLGRDGQKAVDVPRKSMIKFGEEGVAALQGIAAQYLTLSFAAGQYLDINNRVADMQKQAASSSMSLRERDSLLGQVAETPEELEKLIKLSDTLSEQHGLSRQATGQLVFDAKSGGFLQSAEFLAANAAGEMGIGLGSQSSVAMKSPGLFPDQNLTPEQAINATLVAAQRSDANFGMVGGVVSNLAASTAPLGSSLEETVGAVSALSTKFGSPDQAGNRIATFASKAALDERLQGKGLTGAFRAFEDEFSDEEKKKFVGQNQQLAEAVNNLRQEFDLIVERTAEAAAAIGRTGTGGSPSRVMRTNILSDPLRRAKLTSAQSRERRLGAEMGTAETELLRQAGVDKYAADALGRGESMFSIAVGDKAANALTGAGLGGASPAAMDLFSGIGFGDMATALSNPTGMASSVAGFGRRRMFGEGEAGSDPDAAKKILEELQGLRGDMQESNEINRESADASKTTARNTKPKRRDTSRVIEAAGDSDSIIKSARGSG